MYARFARWLCRSAVRLPWLWLAATALVMVPAVFEARHVRLDTNLKRLLPNHSPAVRWSEELDTVVGDGGYFSIIFEGDDHDALQRAVESAAAEVAALPDIESVDHRTPIEFINKYRYTLLPAPFLRNMLSEIVDEQARANPMLEDFEDEAPVTTIAARENEDERLDILISRYLHLTPYQEDREGRLMGMIIRTDEGITNLGRLRELFHHLEGIAKRHGDANGLWSGVSGNLRNRVDEFDVILADLNRAGTISTVGIGLVLAVTFNSVRILPVLLAPLGAGLLVSFALVPILVGDLNLITSFLMMVLFGLGIEYAVHLVKRYRLELNDHTPADALTETMVSTGQSVLTAGLTTALGLGILAWSNFRGFRDFGIIGGVSMLVILASVYAVLPSALVLGQRFRLVLPRSRGSRGRSPGAPAWLGWVLLAVAGAGCVAAFWVRFDYDFTNLSANPQAALAVREREKKIYPGIFAPAALYVAPDLPTLDKGLAILGEASRRGGERAPVIGARDSIRNFVPSPDEMVERLDIIAEIKQHLAGRWVERVEDRDRREIIADFREFVPPEAPPALSEVPPQILRSLTARDGSGQFLLAVNTAGKVRDGRMAMAFTQELSTLRMPAEMRGPTGEKAILAEILGLVQEDGPRLVTLTVIGIFLLVIFDFRSLRQALWVLLPLGSGFGLTLGLMAAFGWKLNFFNMVVLPTMLGVSVDYGVHIYRRWAEIGHDIREAHAELFTPLTACSMTTIMGYAGMMVAHHPGLRSIGNLAVLGVSCCWATGLFLLPGLLRSVERLDAKSRS